MVKNYVMIKMMLQEMVVHYVEQILIINVKKINHNQVIVINVKKIVAIVNNPLINGYFLKDNSCNQGSEKCEECEITPNNCTKCITEGCETCDNKSGFIQINNQNNVLLNVEIIQQLVKNNAMMVIKQIKMDVILNVKKKKSLYIKMVYAFYHLKNKLLLLILIQLLQMILIYLLKISRLKVFVINQKFGQNNSNLMNSNITSQQKKIRHQQIRVVKYHFNSLKPYQNLILFIQLFHQQKMYLEFLKKILEKQLQLQEDYISSKCCASSTFAFCLQLIGPLTIILGGFNFFWTILDILTWINNFYFLNVDYPLNIELFFNQLEWGDIINIPDIISLNSPDDPYYFEAPPKFTEKDVNPLFLNNIQLFFCLISLAILAYICASLVVSQIKNKYLPYIKKSHIIEIFSVNKTKQSVQVIYQQQLTTNIFNIEPKQMPSIIRSIYKELLNFIENFRAKLLQIIGLVFLDICLACVHQLKCNSNQEYVIILLNILLAVVGIIFLYLVFKLYSFVCSQHEILYESKIFQSYYSSLYQGINTKNKLARNYCYVNLMRKALFIFFTVYFYDVPLLQTTLCCLTCFLNLALILYQNPFENKSILIQTAIPNFCIFIIILITVLLAVHDVSNIFSFDQKYLIGWIILFFIGLSIFIQLIFLFQQLFSEMKSRLIQLKNIICGLKIKKN